MKLCDIQIGDVICFQVHINATNTPQVSAPVWRKCVDGGRRPLMPGGPVGYQGAFASGLEGYQPANEGIGGLGFGGGIMNHGGGMGAPPPMGKGGKGKGKGKGGGKGMGGGMGKKGGTVRLNDVRPPAGVHPLPPSRMGTAPPIHGVGGVPRQPGQTRAQHFRSNPFSAGTDPRSSGEPVASGSGGHHVGDWEFVGALPGTQEQLNPEKIGDNEGLLKNTNTHGHGFIKCDAFESDVFIHKKVMDRCKLNPGDMVRFNVHRNSTGTPQCSAPVWVKRGHGSSAGQHRSAPY